MSKHTADPIVSVEPTHASEKTIYDLSSDDVESSKDSPLGEPQYDFTSHEFAQIPELVRNVVGFEDDPTLPVITFRSLLLSALFCIIGSVVSQIS